MEGRGRGVDCFVLWSYLICYPIVCSSLIIWELCPGTIFLHKKALNCIASQYFCFHKPSSVKLGTESLSCKPLLHGRWDIWARKSIAAEGWDFLPQNAFQGTGTEQFLTMTTCICSLYQNKLSDQNKFLNMHYNQEGGCSETYFLCFVCLPGPLFIQIIKTEQSR